MSDTYLATEHKPVGLYFVRRRGQQIPARLWSEPARDEDGEIMDRAPVRRLVIGDREVPADRLDEAMAGLRSCDRETWQTLMAPPTLPEVEIGHNRPPPDGVPEALWEEALRCEATLAKSGLGEELDPAQKLLLIYRIHCFAKRWQWFRAEAMRPHKEALERLDEAFGEVNDTLCHKSALLHGLDPDDLPFVPGVSAHVRTSKEITITNAAALPRHCLVPDMRAVRNAVALGEHVPGITITTRKTIVVKE